MKHAFAITFFALLVKGVLAQVLPQDAYVWQRDWNFEVREAITNEAPAFSSLVVLSAEVTWNHGRPQIISMPVDYATLRSAKCPVGLALRIGPYRDKGQPINELTDLANALVVRARSNGVTPVELQIDFDCAESKLEGYRLWVEAFRQRLAPLPVVITALPSWLKQASFKPLAEAAGGYILQVHSLERPRGPEAIPPICNPDAAKRAVEIAGKLGVPFRVALPTYGYVVAFGPDGHFVGLSAEGPAKTWPQGVQLREVRSDADAMAGLVRSWTTNHPAALRGIIWYRLPNSLDRLNWRWPTLQAVMAGRSPRESSRVELRRSEAGLTEISLVNDGEADLSSRPVIELRWSNARRVASDGLGNFEAADPGPNALQLQFKTNQIPSRLAPGQREAAGWLRLDRETEVQVEIKKP